MNFAEKVKSLGVKVTILSAPALALVGITVSGSGAIAFETADNTNVTSMLATVLTNLWSLATSSMMGIIITATIGIGFVLYIVGKITNGFGMKGFFGGQ